MFSSIAYAMAPAAQQGGEPANPLFTFGPMILIVVVFYFLLIRPQQKRAKQQREMIAAMKVGDPVITNAGIYGRIISLDGDMAEVDLGETKVFIMRGALSVMPANQKSPISVAKKGKKKGTEPVQEEASEDEE